MFLLGYIEHRVMKNLLTSITELRTRISAAIVTIIEENFQKDSKDKRFRMHLLLRKELACSKTVLNRVDPVLFALKMSYYSFESIKFLFGYECLRLEMFLRLPVHLSSGILYFYHYEILNFVDCEYRLLRLLHSESLHEILNNVRLNTETRLCAMLNCEEVYLKRFNAFRRTYLCAELL